ncbi:cytochrome c [Alteromonas sp. ASW11-36]|uniref:Cytochrome c n=1 Tax=Alteromonas arenosi TaxID=3055817 RepID=A0ABT7SSK3_9ALTE|nr:cytochrome c [Alteromonas sp. ASW11-36]MDM7859179.1 cytochrome c [Alteromonas sp. ASW11-36]
MRKKTFTGIHLGLTLALVSALTTSPTLAAGNAEAGKARATVCASCHGQNGISFIPNYPNLAGQKEQYLAESLKAYRDGLRNHMVMSPQAKGLSDEDIANLAAYYSSLDPKPE